MAEGEKEVVNQKTRVAEEELLVTKRLKNLALNVCEPVMNEYRGCVHHNGYLKAGMGLACKKEWKAFEACIQTISADKEAFEDCHRIYVEERHNFQKISKTWRTTDRVGELLDAYRRDKAAGTSTPISTEKK